MKRNTRPCYIHASVLFCFGTAPRQNVHPAAVPVTHLSNRLSRRPALSSHFGRARAVFFFQSPSPNPRAPHTKNREPRTSSRRPPAAARASASAVRRRVINARDAVEALRSHANETHKMRKHILNFFDVPCVLHFLHPVADLRNFRHARRRETTVTKKIRNA